MIPWRQLQHPRTGGGPAVRCEGRRCPWARRPTESENPEGGEKMLLKTVHQWDISNQEDLAAFREESKAIHNSATRTLYCSDPYADPGKAQGGRAGQPHCQPTDKKKGGHPARGEYRERERHGPGNAPDPRARRDCFRRRPGIQHIPQPGGIPGPPGQRPGTQEEPRIRRVQHRGAGRGGAPPGGDGRQGRSSWKPKGPGWRICATPTWDEYSTWCHPTSGE